MSRISIEVSSEQHKQIKALAAIKGQSIKDFVMEKVLPEDKKGDADWKKFEDFIIDRAKKAEEEPLISKSIEELTADFLKSKSSTNVS